MKSARLSVLVFGLYMILAVGLGFMLVPMPILDAFGLKVGDDVVIRFVGMLASVIGFYYVQVARTGMDRFLPWTVIGRFYAAAFMALLVVLGMVGPALLLFAAVDVIAATWTWIAIRSGGQA